MKKFRFIAVISATVIIAEITAFICKKSVENRVEKTSSGAYNYSVVIDAGHGGIDGGVVGASGTVESELNLSVAEKLKTEFEKVGVKVIMTRTTDSGLYGAFSKGFKKRDMKARKVIIDRAMPNAVISIHMNSCKQDKSRRGAQTYYNPSNESGKFLAESVAENLTESLNLTRNCNVLCGDFYMLNCSSYPSVLIECGFVSNLEDEKLLSNDDYQKRLALAIVTGVLSFWQK